MKPRRWSLAIALFIAGAALMTAGFAIHGKGTAAYAEVERGLLAEKLEVQDPLILLGYENARAPKDVTVPKVIIDTAEEARAQAEVIRIHSLVASGGKTYTEMTKDDPNRETYLKGVALRAALQQADMAFRLSEAAILFGQILIGVASASILMALAATYWTLRRH